MVEMKKEKEKKFSGKKNVTNAGKKDMTTYK
jgi:hypothetical protein